MCFSNNQFFLPDFTVVGYNRNMRWKRGYLWTILGVLLLIAAYAATRLIHLTSLPIFTDEAIYIRWSQIGMRDAAWRFISLTDGKQPMFTWVMMMLLRVFDGMDPLFIGRLTSVIAGAGTLAGLWVLSFKLFREKRVAWVTCIIYLMLPFTTWYDRMALYDSMVSTFSVWSLYLGLLLVKNLKLDTALLLGMVLGAGMLNKSSGFLSLYFLPVTLLLFDWKHPKRLIRWIGLILVAAALSQVFYSILRLSPYFHIVGQKNNVFVFSITEWFDQPFRFFAGNLRGMFDWLRQYMTLPLFLAAFASFFIRSPRFWERLLLLLWWALPFAALANFGKVLYPRFILFMTMPLIPLAAYALTMILRTRWKFITVFILVPALYISLGLIANPLNAQIPFADRGQFIDDWPAGGGVKEVVTYLEAKAQEEPIRVYTEGTFGLMPYALEIYLVDHSNIKITGIWPIPSSPPEEMERDAASYPTFFVMNTTQVVPYGWPLTLVGEYKKGKSPQDKKLRFYRVNNPDTISL